MRSRSRAMSRQEMQPNHAKNPAELPWGAHHNAKDIVQKSCLSPVNVFGSYANAVQDMICSEAEDSKNFA
jgi:hypothetical protein